VEDHVHLLAPFGRTITQAEWVKEMKHVSNIWLKERDRDYADFEWQGGYADFGVSRSNLEQVKQYIANQPEHHRKGSFQDELRALLRKHELEWDEKYVWDSLVSVEESAATALRLNPIPQSNPRQLVPRNFGLEAAIPLGLALAAISSTRCPSASHRRFQVSLGPSNHSLLPATPAARRRRGCRRRDGRI
jgi:hypothetical protein